MARAQDIQAPQEGRARHRAVRGATINTLSSLVIEDAIDALSWAEEIGGIEALLKRVDTSFAHFMDWVGASPHFEVLARDPATISPTALCLVISDAWFPPSPTRCRQAL